MFDIAFSELCLVMIIASILFSPQDILIATKNTHYYLRKANHYYKKYIDYLYKELELINIDNDGLENKVVDHIHPPHLRSSKKNIVRYIVDQNGALQEAYDLSSIQPNIINTKPTSTINKKHNASKKH